MVDTIQTYVINSLGAFDEAYLSDYCGCLYYLMGSGGNPTGSFGGSSGYVITGYLDFDYPYEIGFSSGATGTCLLVNCLSTNSQIVAYLKNDPSSSVYPITIQADQGQVWNSTDYDGGSGLNVTGFFAPTFANTGSFLNQRNVGITGPVAAQGSITSFYGTGDTGGGGFYGSNLTDIDGYGYGSGTDGGTGGSSIAVLSFIPRNMIYTGGTGSTGTYFLDIPGATGVTGGSNLLLYSLLAGGGGGGNNYDGAIDDYGGGGGGSGDICDGFLNIAGSTGTFLNIGNGGQANQGSANNRGGNTTLNTIITVGGWGGGNGNSNSNGSGGYGFYGGGGGTNGGVAGQSGISKTNILSYNATLATSGGVSGTGGGSVNTSGTYLNYGKGTSYLSGCCGGGGGGYYGGNGSQDGNFPYAPSNNNAQGYGCGGGGGSYYGGPGGGDVGGGNGSGGYAILRYLSSTNIKLVTVTNSSKSKKYFNLHNDFSSCKGFWYFLHGDSNGGTCKSYHNTGHFLIDNDGVKSIQCSFPTVSNLMYPQIQVSFNVLNGLPQIFTLQSSTGWSNFSGAYINILFYN